LFSVCAQMRKLPATPPTWSIRATIPPSTAICSPHGAI
jgi:hypothetical protein